MSTNAVPLLSAVLDNAQVPHQGLVLIGDAPAFSGLPLFREILRRATSRDAPVLLICALHPPSTILPFSFLPSTKVLDLTDSIPGYSSDEAWSDVQERILGAYSALLQGAQVFIDGIEVLAEDYSSAAALKLVRALLAAIKESKGCPFAAINPVHGLMPLSAKPAQSPSPDLLGAIPTPLIAHPLRNIDSPTSPPSSSRRPPVEPVPRPRLFVAHLVADPRECSRSSSRRDTSVRRSWRNGNHERLGHRGDLRDLGGELARIDGRGSGASSGSESHWRGKGYLPLFGGPVVPLSVVALETLVQVNPVSGPTTSRPGPDAADGTHDALGLPFNLSLTEEQRRRRGDVPIPYAHEGEGVELGWEEEEDDEDDEEI
ncbi:hypothetical protein EHS25_006927 [Saitozyma podzolica]|uniref:Elongator complex protein 5 n=1 Tax=Saitozyma podzolica TaxID=1890683 RepID=A0A427XRF5_9TREE|nr:hypothetical protein EHS25_006927 [Saitozyma podzolica]